MRDKSTDWSKACFNYYGGCDYCPTKGNCKDAFKIVKKLKKILVSNYVLGQFKKAEEN